LKRWSSSGPVFFDPFIKSLIPSSGFDFLPGADATGFEMLIWRGTSGSWIFLLPDEMPVLRGDLSSRFS
jgi:hypothetical protein